LTPSSQKSTSCIFHNRPADRLFKRERQLSAGPYVAIRQRRYEGSIFLERQHAERGTLNGNWLPVHECDRNLSATNALAGKAGKAVAHGIAEHAIERRVRDVIQSAFRVKQIVPKSYSQRTPQR
jgi:hypothetical protein